jgi:hypothetical protein
MVYLAYIFNKVINVGTKIPETATIFGTSTPRQTTTSRVRFVVRAVYCMYPRDHYPCRLALPIKKMDCHLNVDSHPWPEGPRPNQTDTADHCCVYERISHAHCILLFLRSWTGIPGWGLCLLWCDHIVALPRAGARGWKANYTTGTVVAAKHCMCSCMQAPTNTGGPICTHLRPFCFSCAPHIL